MKAPSVPLLLGVSVLLLSGLTVPADHPLVLTFSEDPVMTGSDVTLHCENKNGDFVKAFFYFNETKLGSDPRNMFTIHKVQRSDEGLYSCFTDEDGKTPESRLRVRDPPTTSDPHTTTVYTATTFNDNKANATVSFTPFLSVIRLLLHVVVFCPFCICTILMVSICCSRKTGNKQVVSMETAQDDEEYDDITGVTTKHDFRAAQ